MRRHLEEHEIGIRKRHSVLRWPQRRSKPVCQWSWAGVTNGIQSGH